MKLTPDQLSRITELYERGLYLQAYEASRAVGPLEEWEGTASRVIAGRLAGNIGAQRLSRQLHLRAWRADRADAEACYFFAYTIYQYRGPLAALRFMRRQGDFSHASPHLAAEWLALGASALGMLRDFDAAEERLARAEQLAPASPWIWVERAHLFEMEDRYEDALAAARRALELRAWYRPAVQAVAHALVLLERDAEALALLTEAATHLESAGVVWDMAQIQSELGLYAELRRTLERFAELAPLLEPDLAVWLDSRRSDAAYFAGDLAAAVESARRVEYPFSKTLAGRMARGLAPEAAAARRVLLPVGFVRQHHLTCAPATLSAISRYWQRPADHLGIVEEICYDGTPARSERHWAEQNGWAVCEFTVNWEEAVMLLDRGVPFTFTTVDPGNAHLQAVIGYDSLRGTLLVRDPYMRHWGELDAEGGLKHYAASGPRGMALVPASQAALLDGLQLKEAPLYDALYQVQQSLVAHDRERAEGVLHKMMRDAEGHRLTVQAALAVAAYDGDYAKVLACLDQLVALFPEDTNWKLARLSCLQRLARRSERVEALREICAQQNTDPLLLQQYAEELSADARAHSQALRLLKRAARLRPLDARGIYVRANILWAQRRFDEALECYRFAACLKDTDEQYARSYFIAARHLHQTHSALRLLEGRFHRFGKRSGEPAQTLAWAYEQLGRDTEAIDTLRAAIELRPDDGGLALAAADTHARHGQFAEAERRLAQAEGKAARADWRRAAATAASYRGDLPSALAHWRQVVELDPLSSEANRNVARLLAETESREAALGFLRAAAARFPHSVALHQVLIEWLRDDPPAAEAALRHVLESDPFEAGAYRELALSLSAQKRCDEALAAVELAGRLDPDNYQTHATRGKVYADAGRIAEARAAFEAATKLAVDDEFSILMLVSLAPTSAEKRAALQTIKAELIRQVTFGDGLLAYRAAANGVVEPQETLSLLRAALAARPDLCPAWSAVVAQLTEMRELDEALTLAGEAAARFPLIPRAWVDLAQVHRARGATNDEIAALQQALAISPGFSFAAQQLAEAYERAGDLVRGREIIERALVQEPLNAGNHGFLADNLWKSGEKEQAVERLRRALTLEPGYPWGWQTLHTWGAELQRPGLAAECARELTARRPGEARSWLILAQMLGGEGEREERLRAIERTLALNPRLVEAHAMRADTLAAAKRYNEALAACRPTCFDAAPPPSLRRRAALIEGQRGNGAEMVGQLEALVRDEPGDGESWRLMADYYRVNGPKERYLETAQALARCAPQHALAWGYLGDAQMACDDRAGAKESFRRAASLDPEYEFAVASLFEMQLEDGEADDAARTVNAAQKVISRDLVLLWHLKLAAHCRDRDAARARLHELCLSPTVEPPMYEAAAHALQGALWGDLADEVVESAMALPGANECLGEVWVGWCVNRDAWFHCEDVLAALAPEGKLWMRAMVAYLKILAKRRDFTRVRQYVDHYGDVLRADVQAWGGVGAAFSLLPDYRACAQWLSGWRRKKQVEMWMLWNYVLAVRHLRRPQEAYDVGTAALDLPADQTLPLHRLLLAADDALAGRAALAAERLQAVSADDLKEWGRFVYEVAAALVAFAAPETAAPSPFAALKKLRAAARRHSFYARDGLLSVLYLNALRHVAARSRTFGEKAIGYAHVLVEAARKALRPA